jgi:hypothetical protein
MARGPAAGGVVRGLLEDSTGAILVSVLLGLGLAALFRRVCTGDSCVIIKAPGKAEVAGHVYRIADDCYKYTPYTVPCPTASV